MPPNPPQTPLRRLSQGSLLRLSRSGAYPDAPHGLGFLEPALAELVDEAEALQTNVEGLRGLGDALGAFNESFASWLYVMNMNALTTDWPQVRRVFFPLWCPAARALLRPSRSAWAVARGEHVCVLRCESLDVARHRPRRRSCLRHDAQVSRPHATTMNGT